MKVAGPPVWPAAGQRGGRTRVPIRLSAIGSDFDGNRVAALQFPG